MEPIKFEDNIREKLQEREISPSKTAWEKLETQLESTPQKRSNTSIWFAIAAGFIGVVIIASFMFNKDVIPSQNSQEMVSIPTQEDIVIPLENDLNIIVVEENTDLVKTEKPLKESVKNNNEMNLNKEEIATSIKKEPIIEAIVMTTSKNGDTNTIREINREEIYINAKVAEVIAQVYALQENNTAVSAEEIDTLLLNAQKEIAAKRIVNKQKVDATALLYMVETELETSFRDKVFEALGNGYEKVRTAVVERNN